MPTCFATMLVFGWRVQHGEPENQILPAANYALTEAQVLQLPQNQDYSYFCGIPRFCWLRCILFLSHYSKNPFLLDKVRLFLLWFATNSINRTRAYLSVARSF